MIVVFRIIETIAAKQGGLRTAFHKNSSGSGSYYFFCDYLPNYNNGLFISKLAIVLEH
ncbi:hypothetical protein JOD96_000418 [Flavobacterium sp. 1355]|nr:hypothetical protein [Flavobacterium sp. 1355]